MRHLSTIALLPTLLLAWPAPLAAQTAFQDTVALDGAVAGFTSRPIGAEGGARTPVDKRLRLAQCPTVALSWHGLNHDAVIITCNNPDWRIYVPVVMPAAPVVGPAPAAAPALAKPVIVIKRGDPVTIEVNASGFAITRDGVAMTDAASGGRFLVDVDGSRKPVQAVALEAGRATLPGWAQ